MNKYFSDCLTCVRGLYFFAKTKIVKYIKEKKKKNDYLAGNLFNNDQEQPARILSSEEIDNMINKQAVYAELHPNVNEYKIVKQGGEEEGEHDKKEEHIEEIKKEIESIQEEDPEEEKEKIATEDKDNEKTDTKESIEDLKNEILEFN